MATSSISTKLNQPLIIFFFSLLIKTSLCISSPLSSLHSRTTTPTSTSFAADRFIPSSTSIEYRKMEDSATKALSSGLASFHICEQCECCARDDPKVCIVEPCCYGVVCNLPDKPPDKCEFMPISCGCNSCS